MLETVTGTNGVIIPPAGYLQGVRAICDRYGILMICDEVMSGFGRTGKWFAVDHWGVKPDIMTMAKGLTSGYAPLGAVAMRPEIAAAFNERAYQSGLTYNGHPISLAAAIATIEVMKDEGLVTRAAQTGEVMADMLAELVERHPSVGDVRSIGLFGVIELVRRPRDERTDGALQRLQPRNEPPEKVHARSRRVFIHPLAYGSADPAVNYHARGVERRF